jgi:DNA repair protein RecO (recombination protein O)
VSRIEGEALVVRTVEYGETDVIATLVTEPAGKLSAIVRGARKGSRRIGGALEPVHTIAVLLEDKGSELVTLKESRIVRMRAGVVGNLDALEAAGVALRWVRHLFPPRTPEPEGWRVLVELLDVLDAGATPPQAALARAGLGLLAAVGFGLDFERCAVCGRECPAAKAACVDPQRGGLVCMACGGAATLLLPEVRAAATALDAGRTDGVSDAHVRAVNQLVDRAMAVHAGFER